MCREQKEYLSISLVFMLIAILVAVVGLAGSGGCASWQSTMRQAAFSASAVAKVASEEMPRLLSAQCVKDTQACHRRASCIEAKATGGSIRECCPELSICDARAAKVQAALVAVNQGVLSTLRLVEVGERMEAEGMVKGLLSSVGSLKKMMEELK